MTRMIATAGIGTNFAADTLCPCGAARLVRDCHGLAQPPDGAVAILGGEGPRTSARVWTGQGRRGERLLAVLDGGAGDAIHAMRHVPSVEAHGPVTWVLRPPLERLFRASFPRSEVITYHPLPSAEWRIGTLELIVLNPPAARAPYLHASKPRILAGDDMHVGICACGDRTQSFDRWRSIRDVAVLKPLWTVPGVTWHDLSSGSFSDWADTAELVASLNLVVSVDTGVAHLAGALGRPLLLLNRAPGWGDPGPDDRWQEDWLQPGPLYPGTRVIQQRHRGNWAPAIQQAAAIIASRVLPLAA